MEILSKETKANPKIEKKIKWKNSSEWIDSRLDKTEEKVSKPEGMCMKIIQTAALRKKR